MAQLMPENLNGKRAGKGGVVLFFILYRTAALHDITKQGLSLIRLERIKKKFPPRNTSNTTRPQKKNEEKKNI